MCKFNRLKFVMGKLTVGLVFLIQVYHGDAKIEHHSNKFVLLKILR